MKDREAGIVGTLLDKGTPRIARLRGPEERRRRERYRKRGFVVFGEEGQSLKGHWRENFEFSFFS